MGFLVFCYVCTTITLCDCILRGSNIMKSFPGLIFLIQRNKELYFIMVELNVYFIKSGKGML